MEPKLKAEILCKECGLCCQGIFHSRANIYSKQDEQLAKNFNAQIEFDEKISLLTFLLPCPVYNNICTVFPERPSVCEAYSCDLLMKVKGDVVTLDYALTNVHKIKIILERLIPELQILSGDLIIRKPEILMQKIYHKFPEIDIDDSFKQKHSQIFLDYAVYLFLKKQFILEKSKVSSEVIKLN